LVIKTVEPHNTGSDTARVWNHRVATPGKCCVVWALGEENFLVVDAQR
jgi:hypothetical protein